MISSFFFFFFFPPSLSNARAFNNWETSLDKYLLKTTGLFLSNLVNFFLKCYAFTFFRSVPYKTLSALPLAVKVIAVAIRSGLAFGKIIGFANTIFYLFPRPLQKLPTSAGLL